MNIDMLGETLVLLMKTKNDAEIIKPNIEYHKSVGVDAFVIMDDGSTDGTREILGDLSKDGNILLFDNPVTTKFNLSSLEYMDMAEMAVNEFGADWIIGCDQDEFWVPKRTNSLKKEIDDRHVVVSCKRYNMMPTHRYLHDQDIPFYENTFKVRKPYENKEYRESYLLKKPEPVYPVLMIEILHKVICRTKDLINIGIGKHHAEHESGTKGQTDSIEILHFPIRSFEQFKKKVMSYANYFENNPDTPKNVAWHAKRWCDRLHEGSLEREYRKLILTQEQIDDFMSSGILEEDKTISTFMTQGAIG
jgi:glycosyltransferase involved in cell wall biosynthesis